MNLYEIALPDGPAIAAARHQWQGHALILAGGFTRLGLRERQWADDTGRVHVETMDHYQVAAIPYIWNQLVELALDLFPDEIAFYHAQVGFATIPRRDAPAAHTDRHSVAAWDVVA